jgi:hypothetical protein
VSPLAEHETFAANGLNFRPGTVIATPTFHHPIRPRQKKRRCR